MCDRVMFWALLERHPDLPLYSYYAYTLNAYKSLAVKQNAGFDKNKSSHMYQVI